MPNETTRLAERRERLAGRVRQLLVENLSVRLPADAIDLDAPLFGAGVGLDSVDAIELLVAIETEFDVRLPDGEASVSVTRSVNRVVDFLVAAEVP
jgi:acyl carrier protein